ncbi:hypothetical protein OS493_003565 [Desmophyllum pertusum]|uniref:Uncharacterized protein n=1 Tax=Desmophyllum pertusum TaxID=174260 RepID=A0A9X0DAZ6_9CNID|nr:hypothetical protein OS493_003565 [Desmophyllum pertusum]
MESGIRSLESGIHGAESGIQDPLGFLYMGREAFVRETAKRRLSMPIVEKTHLKEISVDHGKQKAFSVHEGKGVSFSRNKQEIKLPIVTVSFKSKTDYPQPSAFIQDTKSDSNSTKALSVDASFTSENNVIRRLPSLKVEKEEESLRLTSQQRSYKPRSLSIAAAPCFNDTRILKRRATLHNL